MVKRLLLHKCCCNTPDVNIIAIFEGGGGGGECVCFLLQLRFFPTFFLGGGLKFVFISEGLMTYFNLFTLIVRFLLLLLFSYRCIFDNFKRQLWSNVVK